MLADLTRILGVALITCMLWSSPAYAQRSRNQPPTSTGPRKPVIEYFVVVVLLAIPIGLVCRSSRRQT
jgi:hypothetical protein